MFKKVFVMMLALVAVPTFALADWTISATTYPANISTAPFVVTAHAGVTTDSTGKIITVSEGTYKIVDNKTVYINDDANPFDGPVVFTPVTSITVPANPPVLAKHYTLTSVTVDGKKVITIDGLGKPVYDASGNPVYQVNGAFNVNKYVGPVGNERLLLNHSIVANYTEDLDFKFTVKSIATAGGWISKSQTVGLNATPEFQITPNSASTLVGIQTCENPNGTAPICTWSDTVALSSLTPFGKRGGKYTFPSVTKNMAIKGVFADTDTFLGIPTVKAVLSIGPSPLPLPPAMMVAPGRVLEVEGSSNPGYKTGVTFNWTNTATATNIPCVLTGNTNPSSSKVSVTAPLIAGTSCTVSLIVTTPAIASNNAPAPYTTDAIAPKTSAATVVTLTTDSTLASSVPTDNCLTCHDGTNAKRAAGFTGSLHQTTALNAGGPVTCSNCHNPNNVTHDWIQTTPIMSDTCSKCHEAAIGIMNMQVGFHAFTDPTTQIGTTTYGNTYSLKLDGFQASGYPFNGTVNMQHGGIDAGQTSAHRALGTPTVRGIETWMQFGPAVEGPWETNGPCVTCHVNASVKNMPAATDIATAPFLPAGAVIPATPIADHSFSAKDSDTSKQVCMPCHNNAGAFNTDLNASRFAEAAQAKIAETKPYFLAGLGFIKAALVDWYGIDYNAGASPFFFEKGTTTPVTNWKRTNVNPVDLANSTHLPPGGFSDTDAAKLKGAADNLNVLTRDPAAFIHGTTYTQRLIFDTIDWLNDHVINQNAAASVVASGLYPTQFPDANAQSWLWNAGGARK